MFDLIRAYGERSSSAMFDSFKTPCLPQLLLLVGLLDCVYSACVSGLFLFAACETWHSLAKGFPFICFCLRRGKVSICLADVPRGSTVTTWYHICFFCVAAAVART